MIHYFNPGHETAVQNASPYYTARASMIAMQRDLCFLPAWYAAVDDVVLVEKGFDKKYYAYLTGNLGGLPTPITKNELGRHKQDEVTLWGISPQAIHTFLEINKIYEANLQPPLWKDLYTYLNSRQAAKDCLQQLVGQLPQISSSLLPQFYQDLDAIEQAVGNSSQQLLAKAPYSSSGRGLLWLPVTGLTRTERQILHGVLKKQGSVSIEYVLDRQVDFAMEFMSDAQGNIFFAGYSLFYTNEKGAYLGNYLGTQEHIEELLSDKIPLSLLNEIKARLITILSEKYAHIYKGCVGVDMLIYKKGEEYALHPCLEINMRYNMGLLALRLSQNYISPLSEGRFYIDFSSTEGEMYMLHQQMQVQYPARFSCGRLESGYLALCPVDEKNSYRAYMLIE